MRISPRPTASAMTRPVIALVIDPTSIGVVSSAPIPASRTGWAASRSTSATATLWWPASVPMPACWSRCASTVRSPLRACARFGANTQDTTATVAAADEHGEDQATRGEVAPGQDDEHEQRPPAVVGVPAVPAAAQREQHHRRGDRDQDPGDQQLSRPAAGERSRVTNQQRRAAAPYQVWNAASSSTPSSTTQRIPARAGTDPSQTAITPIPAITSSGGGRGRGDPRVAVDESGGWPSEGAVRAASGDVAAFMSSACGRGEPPTRTRC